MFDDDPFDDDDDKPIPVPKAANHPNCALPISERVALGLAGKHISEGAIIPFPASLRGVGIVASLTGKERSAHERMLAHGYSCTAYEVRDDADQLLQVVQRYNHPNEPKVIRPLRYCGVGHDGQHVYWNTWIPGTKPLFGWDRLAKRMDAQVIIVEGEKAAEAAAVAFPNMEAVSWLSGAGAVSKADITPLRDRRIVIWPDNDDAGRKAANLIAARALEGGAASVAIVEVPKEFGEKWDLADPIPEAAAHFGLADLVAQAKELSSRDADRILRGAKRRVQSRRMLGHRVGYSKVDVSAVAAALTLLNPDMVGAKWHRVAACIYHAFGSESLAAFDDWSRKGDKYKAGEPERMWAAYVDISGFEALPLAWLVRWAARESKKQSVELTVTPEDIVMAEIEELNADHAVVERGGKTVVLREYFDPQQGRYAHTFLKKNDFIEQHVRSVPLPPEDGKNRAKSMQLGKLWHASAFRRQYDGIVFSPEGDLGPRLLNLWQGFAVEPVNNPEGWSLLKAHLLNNVARGHQPSYDYILNWLAAGVQKLDRPAGTALVFVGTKGAGKSILIELYGRLFVPHKHVTAISEDIVGRFNAHLEHTILLGVEEAFAPQNRGADGTLKDLITRSELRLEDKFFSTWSAPNRLHIIMTSNNEHVVSADGNDRRYAVFEVANPHAAAPDQRKAYFGAMVRQMDEGGTEAMLGELLARDITGWNQEAIPETPALVRQKLHNLKANPVRAWLHQRLTDGTCIVEGYGVGDPSYYWDDAGPVTIPVAAVRADYAEFCRRNNLRGSEAQLSMQLPKLMPDGFGSRVARLQQVDSKAPTRVYDFPTLADARAAFAAATGIANWAEAGGG